MLHIKVIFRGVKMKKNLFKKIALFAIMLGLVVTTNTTPVHAGDDDISTDSSGNVFCSGNSVSWSKDVNNEMFMAGQSVSAMDIKVNGSTFVAGYDVSLKENNVGGSVFAAGYNVTLGSDVKNNIFAAGSNVILSENTSAKALYAAGANVNVKGDYDCANVSGSNVFFDANVDGDVSIDADTVTFGDNAHISGNLNIKAKENPEADEIAEGNVIFEQVVEKDKSSDDVEKTVIKAGKATILLSLIKRIKKCIYWLFAFALLAVVFRLLFSKHLDDATEMVKKTPLQMLVTGFVGIIAVPFFIVIASVTFIGLPVAGLTAVLLAVIKCTSRVFAFASFGRYLIFDKLGKRFNPIIETMLAVLPAAIIKVIPFIGWIVGLACFMYTLGYVIQVGFNTLSKKKETIAEPTAE